MNFEDAGRRLLGNVKTGKLDEILQIIRAINSSEDEPSIFNIRGLNKFGPVAHLTDSDELDSFNQYHTDDHILEEIINRVHSHATSTLIEITASQSCSGKTALLYLLVAAAVLPEQIDRRRVGGKEGLAVVIDTDDRFDVSLLRNTMRHHIATTPSEEGETDRMQERPGNNEQRAVDTIDETIDQALSQVHIFRPQTFQSILATLDQIPQYLLNLNSSRAVRNIILDSASAFYWQVRVNQEERKVQALDGQSTATSPANQDPSYLSLVQKLRGLSEQFECGVIASTWDLAPPSQPLVSRLNPTLPVTPNVRLEIYRSPVKSFPNNVSVETAMKQKSVRDDVVGRHEFHVSNGKEVVELHVQSGTAEMGL